MERVSFILSNTFIFSLPVCLSPPPSSPLLSSSVPFLFLLLFLLLPPLLFLQTTEHSGPRSHSLRSWEANPHAPKSLVGPLEGPAPSPFSPFERPHGEPPCTHLPSQRTRQQAFPLPRGHFSTVINHWGGPREEEGRSLWLTIKKARRPAAGRWICAQGHEAGTHLRVALSAGR